MVEAADTGPFFHDNSITTIEGAVAFYNSDAFNNSPSAAFLGGGIDLETTQVEAVAAFLRVINALENIPITVGGLEREEVSDDLLGRAISEVGDSIAVLEGGALHPDAVIRLERARDFIEEGNHPEAVSQLEDANALLIDTP